MKNILLILLVFSCVVNGDTFVNGINGQLTKTDGTLVSEADYLDTRKNFNTVFGDKITGIRKNSISTQFVYALDTEATILTQANGATVSTTESMLYLQSSTATNGSAIIESKKVVRYIPGQESYMYFTCVYSQGVADNVQRVGLFDANDGFYIGYEGTQFGVSRRRAGESTFYPVANLELEKGYTLNPKKGNIYRISFGYLGFATINFEVLKPDGNWAKLYKIEYPNNFTVTHITNTYLPVRAECTNAGNTSNIKMYGGSVCAGIVDGGGVDVTSRAFSFSKTFADQTTAQKPIVAFRNKSTFKLKANKIPALLSRVSSANDGSKPIIYKLIKAPTITNTPTWVDVNDNSTLEYSTNGTYTLTGISDTAVLTLWVEAKGANSFYVLENENLLLYPGEIALFYTDTTSATFDFTFGIRWRELF
jgi:hypothetical protein